MAKRRSILEIRLDMLQLIADGESKPTRIMYGTNISWNPCREHLKSLCDQGLIKSSTSEDRDMRSRKIFEITDKGRQVLKYLQEASRLIGSPDLGLRDRRHLPG
jgi:predicted transcriptional regulator